MATETSPPDNYSSMPDSTEAGPKKAIINTKLMAGLNDFLVEYGKELPKPPQDILQERYQIDVSQPLTEYDVPNASAYAASDLVEPGRVLFAQICESRELPRYKAIAALKGGDHHAILKLVAAGPVFISRFEEERYVIFFERPKGKKLSELVQQKKIPLNQAFIIEHILSPLAAAIRHFAQLGIAHGMINPDNIYFYNGVVVGPCVAAPCGYSQLFYCESLERLQALPSAKGEGTVSQDYYAMAVTTLYIMFGPEHFAKFKQDVLLRSILSSGAYNALTLQKDFPEIYYDFFRGLITQSPDDRWGTKQVQGWLEGKRFNVLPPPLPADTSRQFEFGGELASNRRELAYFFSKDWAGMIAALQNNQLAHWISVSMRNKDMADAIGRMSRAAIEMRTKSESQTNELLMNIILLIDPQGPLRIQQLSLHIDGIDTLCAALHNQQASAELQLLAKFIETNMINYWLELQTELHRDYEPPPLIQEMMFKLDRLRGYIRNSGFGFGIERMLYDLNPNMPCLSPMLKHYYVTTMPELLKRLDKMAPATSDEDPIDRHMAAFLASKLGIANEIRLDEFDAVPRLANSPTMLSLRLLAMAQARFDNLRLPGLSHWLAVRLLPLLETVHSKTLRKKMIALLMELTPSGYLPHMHELIMGSDYANSDQNGFEGALKSYHVNAKIIENCRDAERIEIASVRMGYAIAKVLAYLAFGVCLTMVSRGTI